MKYLAKLLCLFVPVKKWRKAIRKALYEDKKKCQERLATLQRSGDFEITEIEGVQVASGHGLNLGHVFAGDAMVVVSEVFGCGEYHFELCSDSVVIDIGMNVGLASLYFASREDVTAVYGYEPFGPTFEQALFNFKINPKITGKIKPFHFGLGDKEKDLELEYSAHVPGQMSTVKPIGETHPWRKDRAVLETVKIKNTAIEIAAIVNKHKGSKIVLKCDTEGSEKEIFECLNANDMLKSIDLIMLEYHFSYDQPIVALLKKNGFILFKQKSATLKTGDFGMIRAIRTY